MSSHCSSSPLSATWLTVLGDVTLNNVTRFSFLIINFSSKQQIILLFLTSTCIYLRLEATLLVLINCQQLVRNKKMLSFVEERTTFNGKKSTWSISKNSMSSINPWLLCGHVILTCHTRQIFNEQTSQHPGGRDVTSRWESCCWLPPAWKRGWVKGFVYLCDENTKFIKLYSNFNA